MSALVPRQFASTDDAGGFSPCQLWLLAILHNVATYGFSPFCIMLPHGFSPVALTITADNGGTARRGELRLEEIAHIQSLSLPITVHPRHCPDLTLNLALSSP